GVLRAPGRGREAEEAGSRGMHAEAGHALLWGPQEPRHLRRRVGLKKGPLTTRYLVRRCTWAPRLFAGVLRADASDEVGERIGQQTHVPGRLDLTVPLLGRRLLVVNPEVHPAPVFPRQSQADPVPAWVAHDPEQRAGDLQLAALVTAAGKSERQFQLF